MDDSRIEKLRAEVLGQLDAARPEAAEVSGLEARVAALEATVAGLAGGTAPRIAPSPLRGATHPSLQVLGIGGAEGGRCVMEPDKPCVQSHACRVLGH
jgi:hypothetical protein